MAPNPVPKICIELLPKEVKQVLPLGNRQPSPSGSGPSQLALDIDKFWRNGRTLRVRFLEGSNTVQDKVKSCTKTWEEYAEIKFEFVDSGDAEIRIAFQQGGGSWSYLGTTNLTITDQETPTMNFGWFNEETRDEEFSRTTIHEFGHALGCIHEHMSPASNIPWDREAVYRYFMGPPNNWTREDIDRNLFNKYPASAAAYSRFDPCIPRNMALSALDKAFIRQVYPKRSLNNGSFRTMDLRSSDKPKNQTSKQFYLNPAYKQPPRVAIGLTELDISKDANIRISTYADRITKEDFVVHTDGWADTILYSAGAAWTVVDQNSDFQVGEFNTLELHPWHEPQPQNSKRINFERSFEEPPKVIVWVKGVDMDKHRDWRVTAGAVSWIAYPADREKVVSGFADTSMQKEIVPDSQKGGQVKFPEGQFNKEPIVLVAIKSFNFSHDHNLRLRVQTDSVSENGFEWKVDVWADSVCHGAGISYLAFQGKCLLCPTYLQAIHFPSLFLL
ncbi:hypothetical protein C7974DRAFT_380941 [Boeremia exigua]|uniref:uncharacterized protein n=1 Tax=Boeremia exigua TaxID=749465 RepID=UPI001E8DF8E3|nr:uncharacterized protein C7974DRAFT_380941 [Boeremia exigua]KAH6612367.1 hypothetical protein C7974DRAFT_380941 [Boeremia exigua]